MRMSQLYAVSGQASLEIYVVVCASSVPKYQAFIDDLI